MTAEVTAELVAERLWREHRMALLARSPEILKEVSELATGSRIDAEAVAERIDAGMALPESNLKAAVVEVLEHLRPRIGARARTLADKLVRRDPSHARWLLVALAEEVGDAMVASWRLFDHPDASRRLWLRDAVGPTMFALEAGEAVRIPPATVASVLVERFGELVVPVLQMVVDQPSTPSRVAAAFGSDGPRVLDAAHRLLVLRRVAGTYRARGVAARLVLAGLGR